ncbi:MAG TPA: pyridoxamine 5'-phosphate oxidase family protein [Bacteroidales bacterium]|nr:pyridoxamine 5'-phosphate oxidase family protein [Bacteroidales bacterium]
MRRKDKEIKDKAVMDKILAESEICRLGFVDEGEAYIVPVNYAFDDGSIYIHSSPHGRKMELLRKNNSVSFEIEYPGEILKNDVPCEWSAKYRSIMGRGTIYVESEREAKIKGLDIIMRKYGAKGELNYDEATLSRMVLLILKITSMTGKQSGDWQ